jgi:hypothetical protein
MFRYPDGHLAEIYFDTRKYQPDEQHKSALKIPLVNFLAEV